MAGIWDQLVDCICRPPRDVYSPRELLGGNNQTFMVGNMEATRLDYELTNKAGQKVMCSHYLPLDAQATDGKLPVVVYCHCNSGSRRDAEEAVWHLLPIGVGVVAFDFTGSGLSDGKWVTLGAHEVEDLAVVIQHLREQGTASSIGLWGRSMGAVTALLYSALDKEIAGMVLDSPFSRLTDLMLEIVVNQKLPIPKVMLKLALKLMRASVKRKAGADINSVSPLDVVTGSLIPAMFGHGEEDSFIDIKHSVKLHEAYNSAAAYQVYKNLVRFKGDHNHPRPAFFYSSVCCFFYQQLHLEDVLLTAGNPADTQQLMRHGSLHFSGESPDQVDRANGFVNTPWSFESMQLDELPPEEAALLIEESADEAAAAAASGYVWDLRASPAASPVKGSSSSSSSRAAANARLGLYDPDPAELNSPRARAGHHAGSSRYIHSVFGHAHQCGSGVVGSAPTGTLDSLMVQQQQQASTSSSTSSRKGRQELVPGSSSHCSSSKQRHGNVPASVEQMRAQSAADGFKVGSRGQSGTIPLPVASGAPLALSSSSVAANTGAATAAGVSSNSGSGAARAATPPNQNSGSGARHGSPGPASILKRWFRGTGSGAGAAASGPNGAAAAAAAAAGTVEGSSSSEGSRSACSGQAQQQQKLTLSPPTAPVMLSSHQRQQQHPHNAQVATPPAAAAAFSALGGTWALTVEGDDHDADAELVAALAASLQDQQQCGWPATAGAQAAQQAQQYPRRAPFTAEEEEEMLAKAIALSLAEVQPQEQPQQQLLGQLPLLQEQQSEHVAQLLLSVGTDEDLSSAATGMAACSVALETAGSDRHSSGDEQQLAGHLASLLPADQQIQQQEMQQQQQKL